jgi:putative membrane protein
MTTLAVRAVGGRDLRPLVPLTPAVLLVLTAIAYPLTSGTPRDVVTWTLVLLGSAVSVSHAGLSRGPRVGAGLLVLVSVTAVGFEALGLATGFPYGRYQYGSALGPTLLGVPFLVPLAWLMMAWPSWVLAERLARRAATRVVVAAAVFAGWDVVLDPQLVQAGYWTWSDPSTNLAGWLLAGGVLMTLLSLLLSRASGPGPPAIGDGAPLLALAWMTLGGALAQAGWLGLRGSAAWCVVLATPVLVALALRRRTARRDR